MIAGGLVAATDAAREGDFLGDGEEGGLADLLEVQLQIAALAVRDGRLGGGTVGLFQKGRGRVLQFDAESGGRLIGLDRGVVKLGFSGHRVKSSG